MRILIFSDTHLTHRFRKKKFLFLQKIILSSDRVIINGDFWDSHLTTFDAFVSSPWKKLFPLLKKKQTVYLYGNHDHKGRSDSRVSLFSVAQQTQLLLKINGKTYQIEHGNNVLFSTLIFEKMPLLMKKTFTVVYMTFENIFSHFIPFFFEPIKKLANIKGLRRKQKNTILICGHSHSPQIHLRSKFINNGFIRYGVGHYIIIEDKTLTLYKKFYAKPFLSFQRHKEPLQFSP